MFDNSSASADSGYPPVFSHGLRMLLGLVFLLFALLVVNWAYLAAITLLEHIAGEARQDFFYLSMFLVHLALGQTLVRLGRREEAHGHLAQRGVIKPKYADPRS